MGHCRQCPPWAQGWVASQGVDKLWLQPPLGQRRPLLLKMVAMALNAISVASQIIRLGGMVYVFADSYQTQHRGALLAIQRLALKGGCLYIFYCSSGSLGTKANIKVVKGPKNNEMKNQTKPLRFFPWARTALININVPHPTTNCLPASMYSVLKRRSLSFFANAGEGGGAAHPRKMKWDTTFL